MGGWVMDRKSRNNWILGIKENIGGDKVFNKNKVVILNALWTLTQNQFQSNLLKSIPIKTAEHLRWK